MIRKILLPLDGSELAERAAPVAAALAARLRAEVFLLHVLERRAKARVHGQRHLTDAAAAEEYLRALAARMAPAAAVAWHVHVERVGDVPESIAQHARETGADLIALTTHGAGGLARAVFGSIAQKVLRQAELPVLVCPRRFVAPQGPFPVRAVLVPVDIDPDHRGGVELGLEMAEAFGARLDLVGIAPRYGSLRPQRWGTSRVLPATTAVLLDLEARQLQAELEAVAERARQRRLTVATELLSGDPATALLRHARRHAPDLIVFASHARKGLEARLNQSLGARLCSSATVPLLITPVEEKARIRHRGTENAEKGL